MFNTTITIFNKKRNPLTKFDEYNRTVLEGHWESSHGFKLGDVVLVTDSSIEVVISMSTDGFEYPSDYKIMTDVSGKWTLAKGDLICKGEVPAIEGFSDLANIDEKMVIDSYEVNDQAFTEMLKNYTARGK